MQHKIIFLIVLILLTVAVFEPWLILALNPATVYLINLLLALIFSLLIVLMAKNNRGEKAKKEIIALIAHQLAAPLASIKWSLEMILNNDFGPISDEQRSVISGTSKKNDKLIYLVEDLMNTSRVEDEKYLLQQGPYSIEKTVEAALELYQDEIKKKSINLQFIKPESELPKIHMDKEKIKLAIQNLLDNAAKYTPTGGNITISLTASGKNILFKIQDNGIGIKNRQKKKVFNKFFRGSNAIKKDPMGHGLGLFFVKNIVQAHNGKVWFDSKENEGTAFYFTLPIR